MRTNVTPVADRRPRRVPTVPQRTADSRVRGGELAAGLAALAFTAEALLAPAVLLAAVALIAAGRLSRWRLSWLALPLLSGLCGLAQRGVRSSAAALSAGASRLASAELAVAIRPARLLDPGALAAGQGRSLIAQLPLALLAGSAEAAAVLLTGWYRRGRPPWRPGLIAAARAQVTIAALRAGHTVTADGCAVGVVRATGKRAEFSWAAAEQGVLVTGRDEAELHRPALAVLCAAIRRRKAVIVIDLAGPGSPPGLASQAAPLARLLDVPVTDLFARSGDIAAVTGRAIRNRAVVLAGPGPGGGAHESAGSQPVGDLCRVLARLRSLGLRGDCLACISGCERADPAVVAALLRVAPGTGTAVLLLTTSPEYAAGLAGLAGTTIACGRLPGAWTRQLAGLQPAGPDETGRLQPGPAGYDADWLRRDALPDLTPGELAMMPCRDRRAVVRGLAVAISLAAIR